MTSRTKATIVTTHQQHLQFATKWKLIGQLRAESRNDTVFEWRSLSK